MKLLIFLICQKCFFFVILSVYIFNRTITLLFQQSVNSPSENVILSPLSIALALALVQQGARGDAQAQITAALGMSPQDSAIAFSAFNDILKVSF